MKKVPIGQLKPNPNNPRIIKDDKFKKLVQSIKELPEMADVRPIVVNTDMVVLGGNMRLKAMREAGWKEVPIEVVDWDEDKQRQFIIKDNVSGGEWDWEMLANQWNIEQLNEWGFDLPKWSNGVEENDMTEDDLNLEEEFDPIGNSKGLQKIVFIFDNAEAAESWIEHKPEKSKLVKYNLAWHINLTTQSI
jgi:hypothetical protein